MLQSRKIRLQQRANQVRKGAIRRELHFALKRAMDVVLATLLLLLLSPVLIVIALLIKLDSPGTIIFTQERVGARRRFKDGQFVWERQNFRICKFRSMAHNADARLHQAYVQAFIKNDDGAMQQLQGQQTEVRKLVRDPRITRVGRFLRKSSLDELPQLWNVVKGEMSLVGPRPAIPYEVEVYESWHHHRLNACPGMTGLWQVTARSSADFDQMVRLDIEYIETPSIWQDIKIILKTPAAVVSSKGAV